MAESRSKASRMGCVQWMVNVVKSFRVICGFGELCQRRSKGDSPRPPGVECGATPSPRRGLRQEGYVVAGNLW
eukprot:5819925-Amphidinium_carterae.1